jgi:hypothetical protein
MSRVMELTGDLASIDGMRRAITRWRSNEPQFGHAAFGLPPGPGPNPGDGIRQTGQNTNSASDTSDASMSVD